MARRRTKVVNYLSNKVLLEEIHKTKTSYCLYDDKKYEDYDMIINSLDNVTEETITTAKLNRTTRLNNIVEDKLFDDGYTNKQLAAYTDAQGIKLDSIKEEDLVFRLMCDDHIPLFLNRKNVMVKQKVNFPAFHHYILKDGQFKCVGKSHQKEGKYTETLARSYMLLVNKYGNKGNWRGYSWLEEMKGQALLRLLEVGLNFNEDRSNNPFAYYTSVMNRAFTNVLNSEKALLVAKNKMNVFEGKEDTFNEQADRDIENHFRDLGEENPYKKITLNRALGYFKKKEK